MSYTVSKLLAIAQAEVGYLEKKSNSQLDDKTANAGSNNYTKYARDLHNAGYYQANKNGYEWCDMFVDWCHLQAAGGDAVEAQRVICQSGPYGAGCTYSAKYYKNAGRFFTSDPKPGDQIFFLGKDLKSVVHTGHVKAVDKTYVYTIEGNTSSSSDVVANGGAVREKKYKLNYNRIYGYGRPLYDEEATTPTVPVKKEVEFTLSMRTLNKGAKGDDVKAMQILLIGYGYKMQNNGKTYGADGSFGQATDNAVRKFQKDRKLTVDGSCGAKTWAKLLGRN